MKNIFIVTRPNYKEANTWCTAFQAVDVQVTRKRPGA